MTKASEASTATVRATFDLPCRTFDHVSKGLFCFFILVCETDAACQSKPSSRSSFLGNENMVCNKKPEAFYETFMSCAVQEELLTSLSPGNYTLTLDLDVKNTTVHAQLWLGQAEQFFCRAPNCTLATLNDNGAIKTKWDCPTWACTCIEPTVLCGGIAGPVVTLGNTINGLKGPFSLTCPQGSKDCDFLIGDLDGFFPTGSRWSTVTLASVSSHPRCSQQ